MPNQINYEKNLLAAATEGRLPELLPSEVCDLGVILVDDWITHLPPHLLTGPFANIEREARIFLRKAFASLEIDPEGFLLTVRPGASARQKLFRVEVAVLSAIDRLADLSGPERAN